MILRRKFFLTDIITIFVVLVIYCAVAFYSSPPSASTYTGNSNLYSASSYSDLARSLLSGRVDLQPQSPIRKPVVNEISTSQNTPVERLSGAQYGAVVEYKGHIYLLAGIAPSTLLYLPYRAIFKRDLSDNIAALVCAFCSFVASSLLLIRVCGTLWGQFSPLVRTGVVLSVGLGNVLTYNLHHVAPLTVAQLWSQACMAGAMLYLYRACETRLDIKLDLFLSSVCIGSALGGLVQSIFLIPLLVVPLWQRRHMVPRNYTAEILLLLLPTAICIALLSAYNMLRFDSYFESGYSLRSAATAATEGLLSQLSEAARSLWIYAASFPVEAGHWPFPRSSGTPREILLTLTSRSESMHGLFVTFPVTLLVIFIPGILLVSRTFLTIQDAREFEFPSSILTITLLAFVLGIVSVLPLHFLGFPRPTMALMSTFDLPVCVLALVVWLFGFLKTTQTRAWQCVVVGIGVCVIVPSVAAGLILGML